MTYPNQVLGSPGFVQAKGAASYSGVQLARRLLRGPHDYRYESDTSGTVTENNRVYFKADASSPEVPFTGSATVRLHRLVGGACVWQGVSDAAGYYWPTGLEVGVSYYCVAIDPTGTHQVTAAGPVVAVKG